jgi:hypothetical protein
MKLFEWLFSPTKIGPKPKIEEFYYGDSIQVVGGFFTGRTGIVIDKNNDGTYDIEFPCFEEKGIYRKRVIGAGNLKLIKRNYEKDKE